MRKTVLLTAIFSSALIIGCGRAVPKVHVLKGGHWVASAGEAENFTLSLYGREGRHVRVYIDGILAIDPGFRFPKLTRTVHYPEVKGYRFRLSSGTHTLAATSLKGWGRVETEFEIKDRLWAVISCSRHGMSFQVFKSPIGYL
jgi:hypothetical protein